MCVAVGCGRYEPFRSIWLRDPGAKASQKLSTQSFAYCSYFFGIAACLELLAMCVFFSLGRCLVMLIKREKRDQR